jgi:hypothetical protein
VPVPIDVIHDAGAALIKRVCRQLIETEAAICEGDEP